jgi:hypothetical protein
MQKGGNQEQGAKKRDAGKNFHAEKEPWLFQNGTSSNLSQHSSRPPPRQQNSARPHLPRHLPRLLGGREVCLHPLQVEVRVQLLAVGHKERQVFGMVTLVDDSERDVVQVGRGRIPEMSSKSNATVFGLADFRATSLGRFPASQ